MTRVGMICTGNICRSPMAEVVLAELLAAEGGDPSLVSSAGTANWHVGSPMDERARRALQRAGFSREGSLAQFADRMYLGGIDLAVVMTREQRLDVLDRAPRAIEVVLLRTLVPGDAALDLADPYYGDDGEFDDCLATIIRACRELAQVCREGAKPAV